MRLAGEGLPAGEGRGFEILHKDQGFGTSQFIETARYHHALESELAKSIGGINSVESARVHLAISRQTSFMRKTNRTKASVMVNLYPGRDMNEGQVAAVVHLVASSVPGMEYEDVSVIDQRGRLLTRQGDDEFAQSTRQLEHKVKLEQGYIQRIEALLEPIVGFGGVSASVSADIDFSYIESTTEEFDPEGAVVRSEQVVDERSQGPGGAAAGVPGALTNQPPGAGEAGETTRAQSNQSSTAIRNYEVGRTINHRRSSYGEVKRLSIAVVVDNIPSQPGAAKEPLTEEQLQRLTALVREAVGYNEERGDTVSVMNAEFQMPVMDAPVEASLIEQPWFWNAVKIGAFALLGLLLLLMVIKPVLKAIIPKEVPEYVTAMPMQTGAQVAKEPEVARIELQSSQFDKDVDAAKKIAATDPGLAANVVKQWLDEGRVNPAA
jgi:flagellar M-ring protein FliF